MRVTTLCRYLLLGLTVALVALPASAADKPSKETRHLQQQLRQAEQEKASLSQQVAASESQIKDALDKKASAESHAKAEAGRAASLSRTLEALKAEKESQAATAAEDHAKLVARLAETERKLSETESAKQQLEAAFASQKAALSGCWERNDRMYKLGNELLDKYEQKGCGSALLQSEPFTGLKRAQIEKMIEHDREVLDDNQIIPPAAGSAATP